MFLQDLHGALDASEVIAAIFAQAHAPFAALPGCGRPWRAQWSPLIS